MALLLLVGVSYAYFSSAVNNDQNEKLSLDTGTMRLRFADNDRGINKVMKFGETVTKKFTIENTGSLESSLSLDWLDLINTYTLGSLTYMLISKIKTSENQIFV